MATRTSSTGWEAAGVCPTISRSPPSVGGGKTGHEGIAVATDRRVLLLRSGALGSGAIELPYDRIDDVEYNDGMVSSGFKFQGSTIALYSFYFDHNNKAGVKGQARRLVDCVRQHLVTPPAADAS